MRGLPCTAFASTFDQFLHLVDHFLRQGGFSLSFGHQVALMNRFRGFLGCLLEPDRLALARCLLGSTSGDVGSG
ncbi:hypothetical protein D9M69_632140 [compost metagenome]